MTTGGGLNSLTDVLFSNELLLNSREKDLLSQLLRRAGTGNTPQGRVVSQTIARAVAETLLERAYGAVQEDILRRLEDLPDHTVLPGEEHRGMVHSMPPMPPAPAPGPPGGPPPRAATRLRKTAPHAPGMQPFSLEPAQCVVYEEFLSPVEMDALLGYALCHEPEFEISEVVSPGVEDTVDFNTRRSRVLMDLDRHHEVLVSRIRACLPGVLEKLGRPAMEAGQVEAQITASGDGDFFRWHTDNGHPAIATRELTFVYFFHREPKSFHGGELRIYDSRVENGSCFPAENFRAIVPRQNQIVFFPSLLAHEITPVECASRQFGDSRFTVNGWFHRREMSGENGSHDECK